MTHIQTDILIVGGGHAGLTLAACLKDQFQICIVEPNRSAKLSEIRGTSMAGARSIAMLAGSVSIMKSLGLWEAISDLGTPIWRTEVNERVEHVRYDARELVGQPFGYGFLNAELRAALDDAVAGANRPQNRSISRFSETFLSSPLVEVQPEPDKIRVGLADGTIVDARLVVGADGRNSTVRKLADIKTEQQRYQQTALTFLIDHKNDHGNAVREFIRHQGPLAFLSLEGKRTGVTLVDSDVRASELADAPVEQLIDEIKPYLNNALGSIKLASKIERYPLGSLHAEKYATHRTVLIGDAAHGVHPIHAQGFNMGVQDISALAQRLVSPKGKRDPGSADLLVAYQRERRPANQSRLFMTDMLARVLGNDWGPVNVARSTTFKTLSAFEPLRKLAVRQGMQINS